MTGLRGILYTEIEAVGAEADLHSGIYGGIAPNPLNTLALIIAGLKGRDGRIRIPGFYDDVRPPSAQELESWRKLPKSDEDLKQEMGVEALEGEADGEVHHHTGTPAALFVAHRTFTTTSVRSSAREESPRKTSTSERIRSPISADVPWPAASS